MSTDEFIAREYARDGLVSNPGWGEEGGGGGWSRNNPSRFMHATETGDINKRRYYEPVPASTENEMTVAKFRISLYFAQITSIVSCFRKYHSKVLKRFSFFEIEESSKIAILTA